MKVNFCDHLNIQVCMTRINYHLAYNSYLLISLLRCNLLETSGTHIREGRRYISIYILQGNPSTRHTHHLRTRMATFREIVITTVQAIPPSVCPPCDRSSSGPRLDHTPF